MIKIAVVGMLTITSLAGQAVPVCMSVSGDDAKTILGAGAKRGKDPSGCEWEGAGHKKKMNVVRLEVPSMFERAHADSIKKGETKDESGLGGSAFSTIPSEHKGTRASIYLLKGGAVLIVDIDDFEAGDAAAYLPQMRELVRRLGPKL